MIPMKMPSGTEFAFIGKAAIEFLEPDYLQSIAAQVLEFNDYSLISLRTKIFIEFDLIEVQGKQFYVLPGTLCGAAKSYMETVQEMGDCCIKKLDF